MSGVPKINVSRSDVLFRPGEDSSESEEAASSSSSERELAASGMETNLSSAHRVTVADIQDLPGPEMWSLNNGPY